MSAMRREPMRRELMRRMISFRPKFIIFLFLLLAVAVGVVMSIKSAQIKRMNAEADDIQRQVLEAYAYAEELERRLAFMDTDDFIRQEARSRFGYMEEGEKRFIIQDEPQDAPVALP